MESLVDSVPSRIRSIGMDPAHRRRLALRALEGYVTGPDAATEATSIALGKLDGARSVILVEGISDQIALETLAARRGRDLATERLLVLPMGGAQAIGAFLRRLGPEGLDLHLAGLCDAAEAPVYRAALEDAGLGVDMERLGFHVCEEDLEDELIRALGQDRVESLLKSQGDLSSFRTMQMQPAWRGQPFDPQMRRFLGAGSRRKLRYARLMTERLDLDHVPRPLDSALSGAA